MTDTIRNAIGVIIKAEEWKGHHLQSRPANLLNKSEFIMKVDHARFVVILPAEPIGVGIVLR